MENTTRSENLDIPQISEESLKIEEEHSAAKKNYFKVQIFLNVLKEVIREKKTTQPNLYDQIERQLTYAKVKSLLPSQGECGKSMYSEGLLGLSRESIIQTTDKVKNQILPLALADIETNLASKFEHLSKILHIPSSDSHYTRIKKIAKQKQQITDIENEMREKCVQLKLLFFEYVNGMREATESLIASLNPVDRLLRYSKDELSFIRTRSEALHLKMKLTEMELVLDTYSSQSIEALKCISSRLNNQVDARSHEIDNLTTKIQAYENVGGEFDSLVKQYVTLVEDMQDKKDMLLQMAGSEATE
ncbi:DgyrCDS6174 [Dimorphilus gyrociliatus]|uniref:DgyrCDS6174 n=1 Tax=Dimorphilus gyrociliatus TaxID=2664684 RepID=A0A7I8VN22_9ANNE|nr:DgyrCDS6174 [Dimorphilus gyrociliatus]